MIVETWNAFSDMFCMGQFEKISDLALSGDITMTDFINKFLKLKIIIPTMVSPYTDDAEMEPLIVDNNGEEAVVVFTSNQYYVSPFKDKAPISFTTLGKDLLYVIPVEFGWAVNPDQINGFMFSANEVSKLRETFNIHV